MSRYLKTIIMFFDYGDDDDEEDDGDDEGLNNGLLTGGPCNFVGEGINGALCKVPWSISALLMVPEKVPVGLTISRGRNEQLGTV